MLELLPLSALFPAWVNRGVVALASSLSPAIREFLGILHTLDSTARELVKERQKQVSEDGFGSEKEKDILSVLCEFLLCL